MEAKFLADSLLILTTPIESGGCRNISSYMLTKAARHYGKKQRSYSEAVFLRSSVSSRELLCLYIKNINFH